MEGADEIDAAHFAKGQYRLVTQGVQHADGLVGVGDVDRLAAIGFGPLHDPEPDAGGLHGADQQALARRAQAAVRRVEVGVLLLVALQHHLGIEGGEGSGEGLDIAEPVFELDLEAALKVLC